MNKLSWAPNPGAAPPLRRILRHGLMEASLIWRNGEQFVLAIAIPIGALLVGLFAGDHLPFLRTAQYPAGVLALALWSTTFTSLAIATGFERRYGVLERLAPTPLRRSGLLRGKALAVCVVAAVQLTLIASVAILLGWRPAPTLLATLMMLTTAAAAAWTFSSFALAMAGTFRAEAVLGMANLVYLIGAGLGLVLPTTSYPGWLQPILHILPTSQLGESLRSWSMGQAPWWPLVVCVGWAIVASVVARKGFRWTS